MAVGVEDGKDRPLPARHEDVQEPVHVHVRLKERSYMEIGQTRDLRLPQRAASVIADDQYPVVFESTRGQDGIVEAVLVQVDRGSGADVVEPHITDLLEIE